MSMTGPSNSPFRRPGTGPHSIPDTLPATTNKGIGTYIRFPEGAVQADQLQAEGLAHYENISKSADETVRAEGCKKRLQRIISDAKTRNEEPHVTLSKALAVLEQFDIDSRRLGLGLTQLVAQLSRSGNGDITTLDAASIPDTDLKDAFGFILTRVKEAYGDDTDEKEKAAEQAKLRTVAAILANKVKRLTEAQETLLATKYRERIKTIRENQTDTDEARLRAKWTEMLPAPFEALATAAADMAREKKPSIIPEYEARNSYPGWKNIHRLLPAGIGKGVNWLSNGVEKVLDYADRGLQASGKAVEVTIDYKTRNSRWLGKIPRAFGWAVSETTESASILATDLPRVTKRLVEFSARLGINGVKNGIVEGVPMTITAGAKPYFSRDLDRNYLDRVLLDGLNPSLRAQYDRLAEVDPDAATELLREIKAINLEQEYQRVKAADHKREHAQTQFATGTVLGDMQNELHNGKDAEAKQPQGKLGKAWGLAKSIFTGSEGRAGKLQTWRWAGMKESGFKSFFYETRTETDANGKTIHKEVFRPRLAAGVKGIIYFLNSFADELHAATKVDQSDLRCYLDRNELNNTMTELLSRKVRESVLTAETPDENIKLLLETTAKELNEALRSSMNPITAGSAEDIYQQQAGQMFELAVTELLKATRPSAEILSLFQSGLKRVAMATTGRARVNLNAIRIIDEQLLQSLEKLIQIDVNDIREKHPRINEVNYRVGEALRRTGLRAVYNVVSNRASLLMVKAAAAMAKFGVGTGIAVATAGTGYLRKRVDEAGVWEGVMDILQANDSGFANMLYRDIRAQREFINAQGSQAGEVRAAGKTPFEDTFLGQKIPEAALNDPKEFNTWLHYTVRHAVIDNKGLVNLCQEINRLARNPITGDVWSVAAPTATMGNPNAQQQNSTLHAEIISRLIGDYVSGRIGGRSNLTNNALRKLEGEKTLRSMRAALSALNMHDTDDNLLKRLTARTNKKEKSEKAKGSLSVLGKGVRYAVQDIDDALNYVVFNSAYSLSASLDIAAEHALVGTADHYLPGDTHIIRDMAHISEMPGTIMQTGGADIAREGMDLAARYISPAAMVLGYARADGASFVETGVAAIQNTVDGVTERANARFGTNITTTPIPLERRVGTTTFSTAINTATADVNELKHDIAQLADNIRHGRLRSNTAPVDRTTGAQVARTAPTRTPAATVASAPQATAPNRATATPTVVPIPGVTMEPIPAPAPRADAPRADAPRADAPRADAPRADAPRADAPRADAPRADAPRADAPRADAPRADAPRADAPRADAPRADAPRADTPRADAPRADAPRADAPRADAPRADAPRADAPRADAPRADAPRADAPRADAPRGETAAETEPETIRAEIPVNYLTPGDNGQVARVVSRLQAEFERADLDNLTVRRGREPDTIVVRIGDNREATITLRGAATNPGLSNPTIYAADVQISQLDNSDHYSTPAGIQNRPLSEVLTYLDREHSVQTYNAVARVQNEVSQMTHGPRVTRMVNGLSVEAPLVQVNDNPRYHRPAAAARSAAPSMRPDPVRERALAELTQTVAQLNASPAHEQLDFTTMGSGRGLAIAPHGHTANNERVVLRQNSDGTYSALAPQAITAGPFQGMSTETLTNRPLPELVAALSERVRTGSASTVRSAVAAVLPTRPAEVASADPTRVNGILRDPHGPAGFLPAEEPAPSAAPAAPARQPERTVQAAARVQSSPPPAGETPAARPEARVADANRAQPTPPVATPDTRESAPRTTEASRWNPDSFTPERLVDATTTSRLAETLSNVFTANNMSGYTLDTSRPGVITLHHRDADGRDDHIDILVASNATDNSPALHSDDFDAVVRPETRVDRFFNRTRPLPHGRLNEVIAQLISDGNRAREQKAIISRYLGDALNGSQTRQPEPESEDPLDGTDIGDDTTTTAEAVTPRNAAEARTLAAQATELQAQSADTAENIDALTDTVLAGVDESVTVNAAGNGTDLEVFHGPRNNRQSTVLHLTRAMRDGHPVYFAETLAGSTATGAFAAHGPLARMPLQDALREVSRIATARPTNPDTQVAAARPNTDTQPPVVPVAPATRDAVREVAGVVQTAPTSTDPLEALMARVPSSADNTNPVERLRATESRPVETTAAREFSDGERDRARNAVIEQMNRAAPALHVRSGPTPGSLIVQDAINHNNYVLVRIMGVDAEGRLTGKIVDARGTGLDSTTRPLNEIATRTTRAFRPGETQVAEIPSIMRATILASRPRSTTSSITNAFVPVASTDTEIANPQQAEALMTRRLNQVFRNEQVGQVLDHVRTDIAGFNVEGRHDALDALRMMDGGYRELNLEVQALANYLHTLTPANTRLARARNLTVDDIETAVADRLDRGNDISALEIARALNIPLDSDYIVEHPVIAATLVAHLYNIAGYAEGLHLPAGINEERIVQALREGEDRLNVNIPNPSATFNRVHGSGREAVYAMYDLIADIDRNNKISSPRSGDELDMSTFVRLPDTGTAAHERNLRSWLHAMHYVSDTAQPRDVIRALESLRVAGEAAIARIRGRNNDYYANHRASSALVLGTTLESTFSADQLEAIRVGIVDQFALRHRDPSHYEERLDRQATPETPRTAPNLNPPTTLSDSDRTVLARVNSDLAQTTDLETLGHSRLSAARNALAREAREALNQGRTVSPDLLALMPRMDALLLRQDIARSTSAALHERLRQQGIIVSAVDLERDILSHMSFVAGGVVNTQGSDPLNADVTGGMGGIGIVVRPLTINADNGRGTISIAEIAAGIGMNSDGNVGAGVGLNLVNARYRISNNVTGEAGLAIGMDIPTLSPIAASAYAGLRFGISNRWDLALRGSFGAQLSAAGPVSFGAMLGVEYNQERAYEAARERIITGLRLLPLDEASIPYQRARVSEITGIPASELANQDAQVQEIYRQIWESAHTRASTQAVRNGISGGGVAFGVIRGANGTTIGFGPYLQFTVGSHMVYNWSPDSPNARAQRVHDLNTDAFEALRAAPRQRIGGTTVESETALRVVEAGVDAEGHYRRTNSGETPHTATVTTDNASDRVNVTSEFLQRNTGIRLAANNTIEIPHASPTTEYRVVSLVPGIDVNVATDHNSGQLNIASEVRSFNIIRRLISSGPALTGGEHTNVELIVFLPANMSQADFQAKMTELTEAPRSYVAIDYTVGSTTARFEQRNPSTRVASATERANNAVMDTIPGANQVSDAALEALLGATVNSQESEHDRVLLRRVIQEFARDNTSIIGFRQRANIANQAHSRNGELNTAQYYNEMIQYVRREMPRRLHDNEQFSDRMNWAAVLSALTAAANVSDISHARSATEQISTIDQRIRAVAHDSASLIRDARNNGESIPQNVQDGIARDLRQVHDALHELPTDRILVGPTGEGTPIPEGHVVRIQATMGSSATDHRSGTRQPVTSRTHSFRALARVEHNMHDPDAHPNSVAARRELFSRMVTDEYVAQHIGEYFATTLNAADRATLERIGNSHTAAANLAAADQAFMTRMSTQLRAMAHDIREHAIAGDTTYGGTEHPVHLDATIAYSIHAGGTTDASEIGNCGNVLVDVHFAVSRPGSTSRHDHSVGATRDAIVFNSNVQGRHTPGLTFLLGFALGFREEQGPGHYNVPDDNLNRRRSDPGHYNVPDDNLAR